MTRYLPTAALALMLACSDAASSQPADYTNPVITGFSSDPSVCRMGGDYYLAASTFAYFPGVPIFHSKDLVHWRQVGNALTRPSQLPLQNQGNSRGIFAPTLRCHGGKFYLVTTNISNGGNFIATATDPAGPWSEVTWLNDGGGMDPSLLFDDDGKIYYTRHGGGEHGGAYQAELDPQTLMPKEAPRLIWSGTGGVWPEGPHLYKHNGWYYLMISEGGTSYNHSITVARSRSPWGPFEANPANPIVTHRNHPDLPLQAIGHGDLVQTPDGNWWITMLAIRPNERTHHIGRETVLAPVTWSDDGWPVINGGKPIQISMSSAGLPPSQPWPSRPATEQFDGKTLGPEWYGLRAPADALYSLTERPGYLRLKGSADTLVTLTTPAFVGIRQRDLAMHAAAALDFKPRADGQLAGLVVRQDESNHYQLVVARERGKRHVKLLSVIKGRATQVQSRPVPDGDVTLAIDGKPASYAFSYTVQGKTHALGTLPTAPLSSEKAGGFTGVFLGLYATNPAAEPMPPADVAWFTYQGKD
ncbi:family 43 glycosylhydrolase [Duganella sp. FT92W]|uniref:Family 43 glycosylhydrolase n=1 Tax=Pseudoduganella rivuli TaxID=2666085 RepID=A0A7X2LRQ8_9BURK|nr:glycoside hydrolase family 43 protein [Pseudoduganella rivuli]MRV72690.1 family 43 glycosylhydrolase [Pseudoduganella rivuli]